MTECDLTPVPQVMENLEPEKPFSLLNACTESYTNSPVAPVPPGFPGYPLGPVGPEGPVGPG